MPPEAALGLGLGAVQDRHEPSGVTGIVAPIVRPAQQCPREEDLLHPVVRIHRRRPPVRAQLQVAVRDPDHEVGVTRIARRGGEFTRPEEPRLDRSVGGAGLREPAWSDQGIDSLGDKWGRIGTRGREPVQA